MSVSVAMNQLSHAFNGVQVLNEVSIAVAPNTVTAIVGPSGCGKSTLLRILAGLQTPDSGAALIDDESVVGRPGHVAFMPQRDLLLPWRRVIGNAILGAQVRGMRTVDATERAQELLALFGLNGFERAWPSQLSGGMRQRLALLRTFLVGLPVLLLDEPFGALDAITRRSMHEWLQTVLASEKRTVVLITHDVEEALLLSDQIVVMSQRPGRVVASVAVPFARPRSSGLTVSGEFVELKARVLSLLDSGGDH